MEFFFADDSAQSLTNTRKGMGGLVAIGGIQVRADCVADLERALDDLCLQSGFPKGEEFKWSPGRDLWMRTELVSHDRETFFLKVVELAAEFSVTALVVISDVTAQPATGVQEPELDITRLFLERVDTWLARTNAFGVVVADRPGGGSRGDTVFLAQCFETLEAGTDYVKPARVAFNVVSTQSHLIRLLQLADVVTGCTLAFVAGQTIFTRPIFTKIMPWFHRNSAGQIGGTGVKIHPDYRYRNLYHWLLGDQVLGKSNSVLPDKKYPFAASPEDPRAPRGRLR